MRAPTSAPPASASNSSSTSGAPGTARAPSSRPQYNLSQQSTMRDALLTGITFDIFQRHADKVAVAAVAQSINCIHSLMLAQGDKFCVTPTFHVFQMYLPHRGAQADPRRLHRARPSPTRSAIRPARSAATATSASFLRSGRSPASAAPPRFRTTARRSHSPSSTRTSTDAMTTEIAVRGASIASAKGTVLAEKDVHAHNDFAHPNAVEPVLPQPCSLAAGGSSTPSRRQASLRSRSH